MTLPVASSEPPNYRTTELPSYRTTELPNYRPPSPRLRAGPPQRFARRRKLQCPSPPAALRLDDIEDAVHHAPVRGERAEIWIPARIRRRAEVGRHGLARIGGACRRRGSLAHL